MNQVKKSLTLTKQEINSLIKVKEVLSRKQFCFKINGIIDFIVELRISTGYLLQCQLKVLLSRSQL